MSIVRVRCQACRTRLIAGYVLPALVVIGFIALFLLLTDYFAR